MMMFSLITVLAVVPILDCLASGAPCKAIEAVIPGRVVYPNTSAYDISNNYWSTRQSDLEPSCFVQVSSAEDVAEAVKVLTRLSKPFTVKSGGHTAFPSGSNIQDGVTIDLGKLNDISVWDDLSTASIGPGARWINVSEALDPLGLAVVGGRSPDVGVAGLILGGGVSFLSGRRGWACDNVKNFQVVLVSGEIVNVNPTENEDLYWALRGGGGSSFGIVTRFDLDVYEQGDLWGRLTTWPTSETYDVLVTFISITREALHKDLDAHLFFLIGTFDLSLPPMAATFAFHTNHLSPPNGLFNTFESLARLPGQIINNTAVASLSSQMRSLWNPYGLRQTWWDTTVRDGVGSNSFMSEVVARYNAYADELSSAGEARGDLVIVGLVVQPVTSATREAMQRNGGNALGLEPSEFPLFLISTTVTWADPVLDRLIEARSKNFFEQVDALAKQDGFYHGFKYMNYAGKSQQVFQSYGESNHRRLREVARRYDPKGLLRKLWKGYFKL